MVLDFMNESIVNLNETNVDTFDGFDALDQMSEATEELLIESMEMIQEAEDTHNILFVTGINEEYQYLKENGYSMDFITENKVTEFFTTVKNAVMKWLKQIGDAIEKFIDKMSQKINGIDKLKKMTNPKYKASKDFEDTTWGVLYSSFNGKAPLVAGNEWRKDGYLIAEKFFNMMGTTDSKESVEEAKKKAEDAFKTFVKLSTGKEDAKSLRAKDIVSKVKGEEKTTYKADGTNVPSLNDILKVIDNVIQTKNKTKEFKNGAKVAADGILKELKKAEKEMDKDKKVEGKLSFYSSTVAKLNSYNTALCTAHLILIKDCRSLAIRLAKGFKPEGGKDDKKEEKVGESTNFVDAELQRLGMIL